MADNQKYYYMRLKENFFDSPELKTIESMRGGYKYSNILLKMYLLSLRDGGRLSFRQDIPYDVNMLSKLTGFSKIEIENALKIFKKFKLIEILDTGTIYMMDIQNLIGKSSTEADRQREYQTRISNEKQGIVCKKSNKKSNKITTPEIEIEKEIEKSKRESTEKQTNIPPSSVSSPALLLGQFGNVLLTQVQLDWLKNKYPDDYTDKINHLSEYMYETGKTYQNHFGTICKWAKEDGKKTKTNETGKPEQKQQPDESDLVYQSYLDYLNGNHYGIPEQDKDQIKSFDDFKRWRIEKIRRMRK